MESLYEYGSRAGFWRLYRTFTDRNLPVTVYAVAMTLARNPEATAAMVAAGWEMATHGYRWIDYQYLAESVERDHIAKAVEIHTRMTGTRPLGWYQGRCSPNRAGSSPRRVALSITPTAMPTTCPIGTAAPASRS
jgi:peptidoglycan/xylan/chitin deacetylase (PgdA/CDA1 family)